MIAVPHLAANAELSPDALFVLSFIAPSFQKYTGPYLPSNSFSLINDPRNKYDTLYTVNRLGNVYGGRSVQYVNAEVTALEDAVIKSIKSDQPVFFGECLWTGGRISL